MADVVTATDVRVFVRAVAGKRARCLPLEAAISIRQLLAEVSERARAWEVVETVGWWDQVNGWRHRGSSCSGGGAGIRDGQGQAPELCLPSMMPARPRSCHDAGDPAWAEMDWCLAGLRELACTPSACPPTRLPLPLSAARWVHPPSPTLHPSLCPSTPHSASAG